jgi:peptidoglycan hydrolase-like protein with peptidoglycan-binding domain
VGDRRVRQLQDALAGRGYYQGPRDGLFTGQTVEAMDRFQRDHGLREGRFTGETANRLGIAP